MHRNKLGRIAFVVDERLSRERRGILGRIVNAVRHFAEVRIFQGDIDEKGLLKRLQDEEFSLVLVPWYRYLSWSRIEALYGLTRTSGPTFAGYFCETLEAYELGDQADHLRAILLDFAHLTPSESALVVACLIQDSSRAGLKALIGPEAPVYCESWQQGQGLGLRFDAVIKLPEIAKTEWIERVSTIRILLGALWSLVYEHGPGKSELAQALGGKCAPRAHFQLGCGRGVLGFRLCFSMPGWSAKDALAFFWPDPSRPSEASQLLIRHADFLRFHTVEGTNEMELVACLLASRPADRAYKSMHTLWIEPIAPALLREPPQEAPGPQSPWLRPLPSLEDGLFAKNQLLTEAAAKIRELKRAVEERDELIRDLKSGGVGTAPPLPPADAEGLLEAFQERYFEARHQIRQFELQIAAMEKDGGTPEQVEQLRGRMAELAAREQEWIRRIGATIESCRAARKATGG